MWVNECPGAVLFRLMFYFCIDCVYLARIIAGCML